MKKRNKKQKKPVRHVFGVWKAPKGAVVKCGGLVEVECSAKVEVRRRGKI